MKIKLNGKTSGYDVVVLASDGIYGWDSSQKSWEKIFPNGVAREIIFNNSEQQLKEHPDYLDLDELFTKIFEML